MNLRQLTQLNLLTPVVICVGLLFSIALGYAAGSGNFSQVGKVGAGILLIAFAVSLRTYTWQIALFLCFTDFLYAPFGFSIATADASLALAALYLGVTWWQKQKVDPIPLVKELRFKSLNLFLLLWLFYVAGHFLFNCWAPYRPQEFAFKNLAKTYVVFAAPLLIAFYFMNRPPRLHIREDFPARVAKLLLFGLLVNIVVQIYGLIAGTLTSDYTSTSGVEGSIMRIPVLLAYENFYALRMLPVFGGAIATAYLYSDWMRHQSAGIKLLFVWVLVFSFFGAILSGGRAAVLFMFIQVFAILYLKRRFALILTTAGILFLISVLANVFADQLQHAPFVVSRSLNWALLKKDSNAAGSIEGSTDWRERLFSRAVDEWRSDSRIFWFGRASYSYGIQDQVALTLEGEDAKIASSLRRGATHNLITDHLILFGVVGLILYCGMIVSLGLFLWRIYRAPEVRETIRALALICFLIHSFYFVYGLLGGATFSSTLAWLIVLLFTALYRFREEEPEPVVTAPFRPARLRAPLAVGRLR